MADISSMTLLNGDTYDLKDKIARASIPYAQVDSTSTATVYTATVEGITELYDGVTVMLHNGVVTSASGFTVNINNLGAKKCYNNMTNATQDTTIFNVAYTMLFVYSEALDDGNGGWWIYRGYDGNTNTIGYQIRTSTADMLAVQTGYRYRLWLTDADGQGWVPMNTSTSTNATTERSMNTHPIDPFGAIVYCSHNATKSAGVGLGQSYQWAQYTLTIGYSYVKTLVDKAPVYLVCAPQADGSAIMTDIATALPTTKDGYIYIFLGIALSTTTMELELCHPVYWHDGTGIRIWTGAESSGGGGSTVSVSQTLTSGTEIGFISVDGAATKLYAPTPQSITVDSELSSTSENPVQNKVINSAIAAKYTKPNLGIPASDLAPGAIPSVPPGSSRNPKMDGTASAGTSGAWAREDHVHPTDTSRQATITASGILKGNGSGNVSAAVAGTDYALPSAIPSASSTTPAMDGTAAVGTSSTYARGDHVHPTDTSRQAALVSGTNIKTINNTSLLGSGNISTKELPTVSASDNGKVLTVVNGAWASGDITLTEEEVDTAVEAAFIAHAITYPDDPLSGLMGIGVGTKPHYNEFAQEANAGEIIYLSAANEHWKPTVTAVTSGSSISLEDIGTGQYDGYSYSLTMPAEPIYIVLNYVE